MKDLLDDAESCKRRMIAASALIGGLGGEKVRWTEQSKEFKSQIDRYCDGFFLHIFGKGPFETYFLKTRK